MGTCIKRPYFYGNQSEKMAVQLFDDKFGVDVISRFRKFKEEFNELLELFEDENGEEITEKDILHIKDELSDCQGTLTHLASLFKLNQNMMLVNCINKVNMREVDPNYRRF